MSFDSAAGGRPPASEGLEPQRSAAADRRPALTFVAPGAHIVFICCRCGGARLSLPAEKYITIDGAFERARELRWTFQPDGNSEDGAVVCPSCSKGPRA